MNTDYPQNIHQPDADCEPANGESDYDTMMDMINHYEGESHMDTFVEKVNTLNKEIDGYIQTIYDAQDALASAENELNELLDENEHAE